MMKYARILVAITFILGLGAAGNAETRPEIVVTVPFTFVVSGKTLPAGTYTVGRLSGDRLSVQILRSREHGVSVFVNPVGVKNATADKPLVSFQQVGEQHFLSAIQTADDVYDFQISRSVITEAAARSHNNASVSGSSGSS
jgi:hypothetical protein